MTSGSSRFLGTAAACSSGTMPVRVAPPGSSMFTVTGVPRRSAAMIRDSDSAPAREGP